MKTLLIAILCLFSFSAFAQLETFFSSLEGRWSKISADTYRETTDGEIFHSVGTRFEAVVTRSGYRWDFNEDMCWATEGEAEVCGPAAVSYEVEGDNLYAIVEGQRFQTDVLESGVDYLIIVLSTEQYSFTAILTLEGNNLSQESVMEFPDGTKEYQILSLGKR